MDGPRSAAVREAFVRLYEQGLIYRGDYIVNWCPRCQTAISDLEVIHEEQQGKLWEIRYPVVGEEGSITVATTRPETMLGDTAVAVNPDDERYAHLHGKMLRLPLTGREIPMVTDELGRAAISAPARSRSPRRTIPTILRLGQRQGLPSTQHDGRDGAYECRRRCLCTAWIATRRGQQVLEDLEKEGLLVRDARST